MPLCFVAESVNYSSTEKAAAGRKGEDACFTGRYGIGVADGVGGWAEMGVDAGEYSRGLMAHAGKHIEDATAKGATVVDPLEALTVAHRAVRVLGSSTACLATVGSDGVLRVRNLGDSGLMLWRHHLPLTSAASRKLPLDEAAKLWTLESETAAQTWAFNAPYQLEYSSVFSPDGYKPSQAQEQLLRPKQGDVVIAATDGLFDNLYSRDVQAQLAKFDFAPCRALAHARRRRQAESARTAWELDRAAAGDNKRPLERLALLGVAEQLPVTDAELEASEKACRATLQSIATMLAIAAQRVGGDPTAASPFAAGARKHGWDYRGGKMDDVCVVAAVIVADETRLPKVE